jgi:hypothetical protein
VFRYQSLPWQWSTFTSLHIDPAPQDVGSLTRRGKAPRSEPLAALRQFCMQDPGFEVPRIYLLGTWVNKPKIGHLGDVHHPCPLVL